MEEKSIDELSFEEVLEQLELTINQGKKYSWHIPIIKLFKLTEKLPNKNFNETILSNKHIKSKFPNIFLNICRYNYSLSLLIFNSILDKGLKENIMVQSFGQIFEKNSEKAIELLNSISSKELQDKTISENFGYIFKRDSEKAIELIGNISSKELQDKIILEFFERIFYIDSEKAIELIDNISSKELKDKIILEFFERIFYIDSQKAIELINSIAAKELRDKLISTFLGQLFKRNFQKAIKLINSISSEELRDKIISKFFRQIFKRDFQKAIELINIISSEELRDKIIVENFRQIFKKDSQKAIELINIISSKELQNKIVSGHFRQIFKINSQKAFYDSEKVIFMLTHGYIKMKSIYHYMNFALKNSIVPNIDLVEEIVNKDLRNRIIEIFFDDFMQKNRALSIRLISKIYDNRLQKRIVDNYQIIHNSMDIELLIFGSKNIIKEKLIPLKIDELNNIQKNINSQNRSNAIYKAHREVQKEDNSELELEELSVNRLSFLIIHEEEESNFNRLLNEFIKRVQKEGKNYSELIFKTIRESKIQNDVLLELEAYIDKRAVINRLKKLKKDRTSQKSVNKILETVLKSTKKTDKEKEKYFLYLFRRKHDIKTIHAVIPQIATKDFGLAKRLLNRVQDKKLKEKAQKEMFLNLHENLEEMMYAYKRVEDFHTKERLSKIALAHHLPTFTNSFFHKSLSALDSQNIINTLDELSTIAPREVLKYYKEIKDDIGDRVNEVIKKIKELKSEREKAEILEDEELFDKVDMEAQKLKDKILEDRELFEAFLKKLDITEFKFKRGSLWDLV